MRPSRWVARLDKRPIGGGRRRFDAPRRRRTVLPGDRAHPHLVVTQPVIYKSSVINLDSSHSGASRQLDRQPGVQPLGRLSIWIRTRVAKLIVMILPAKTFGTSNFPFKCFAVYAVSSAHIPGPL